MSQLALSDSFEYLCYGSTAFRTIFTLTLVIRIWRLKTSDFDDQSRSPHCKGQCWATFCETGPTLRQHCVNAFVLPRPSGRNRFLPQIDPVQNHGTFLWTVITETLPRIIRAKIVSLQSVTFQLPIRMLRSQLAQSIQSNGHFFNLGVEIALRRRDVEFFE